MDVEIRVNGRMELRLAAETPVEKALLAEMVTRAKNGRPVKLVEEDGVAVLWMEGK